MKCSFKLPVGYSDHTIGINIPLAAAAMGANVIEKHFTLDKNMDGPDHAVSADPEELKNLITGIREIEKAFGTGIKEPTKAEIEMKNAFRRSIVANVDIRKGEILTEQKVAFKRPGTGISPKHLALILRKKAKRNIKYDELLDFQDF
jgi:sialic acid synthase SpsE